MEHSERLGRLKRRLREASAQEISIVQQAAKTVCKDKEKRFGLAVTGDALHAQSHLKADGTLPINSQADYNIVLINYSNKDADAYIDLDRLDSDRLVEPFPVRAHDVYVINGLDEGHGSDCRKMRVEALRTGGGPGGVLDRTNKEFNGLITATFKVAPRRSSLYRYYNRPAIGEEARRRLDRACVDLLKAIRNESDDSLIIKPENHLTAKCLEEFNELLGELNTDRDAVIHQPRGSRDRQQLPRPRKGKPYQYQVTVKGLAAMRKWMASRRDEFDNLVEEHGGRVENGLVLAAGDKAAPPGALPGEPRPGMAPPGAPPVRMVADGADSADDCGLLRMAPPTVTKGMAPPRISPPPGAPPPAATAAASQAATMAPAAATAAAEEEEEEEEAAEGGRCLQDPSRCVAQCVTAVAPSSDDDRRGHRPIPAGTKLGERSSQVHGRTANLSAYDDEREVVLQIRLLADRSRGNADDPEGPGKRLKSEPPPAAAYESIAEQSQRVFQVATRWGPRTSWGYGSAVLVNAEEGLVLTNNHVLIGMSTPTSKTISRLQNLDILLGRVPAGQYDGGQVVYTHVGAVENDLKLHRTLDLALVRIIGMIPKPFSLSPVATAPTNKDIEHQITTARKSRCSQPVLPPEHELLMAKGPLKTDDSFKVLSFPGFSNAGAGLNVVTGKVTAKVMLGGNNEAYQTDATVQSGSSGGAIVDEEGFLVAIACTSYNMSERGIAGPIADLVKLHQKDAIDWLQEHANRPN